MEITRIDASLIKNILVCRNMHLDVFIFDKNRKIEYYFKKEDYRKHESHLADFEADTIKSKYLNFPEEIIYINRIELESILKKGLIDFYPQDFI